MCGFVGAWVRGGVGVWVRECGVCFDFPVVGVFFVQWVGVRVVRGRCVCCLSGGGVFCFRGSVCVWFLWSVCVFPPVINVWTYDGCHMVYRVGRAKPGLRNYPKFNFVCTITTLHGHLLPRRQHDVRIVLAK